MTEYHKINSVFLRDPATKHKNLLIGQYALPEYEYLANNDWTFTEKVDGTNIRVIVAAGGVGVSFGGRTDEAQIPAKLVNALSDTFIDKLALLNTNFPDGAVLYGEGFGAGIQKGGGNYRQDQGFVLFDVKVGNWWLERETVAQIANTLGLERVPLVGRGTLLDMVDLVRNGFNSSWGDFLAEGVVARPTVELFDRGGKRIITKIKHKDFV